MKQKSKETLIHAKGVIDGLRVVYFGNELSSVFSSLANDIRGVLEDEEETESEGEKCSD